MPFIVSSSFRFHVKSMRRILMEEAYLFFMFVVGTHMEAAFVFSVAADGDFIASGKWSS